MQRRFTTLVIVASFVAAMSASTVRPAWAEPVTLKCPVINVVDRQGHRGTPTIERITVDAAKHVLLVDGEREPQPYVTFAQGSTVVWQEPASGGTATFSYLLNWYAFPYLISGVMSSRKPFAVAMSAFCTPVK